MVKAGSHEDVNDTTPSMSSLTAGEENQSAYRGAQSGIDSWRNCKLRRNEAAAPFMRSRYHRVT